MTHISQSAARNSRLNNMIYGAFTAATIILAGLLSFSPFTLG